MAPFALPVFAALFAYAALATRCYVLWWPAIVMLGVAAVYALRLPRAFGKRADGSLAPWAWIAWAPWFAYMWIAHELARRATREPVADEVAPGIWVGRRPRPGELPVGTSIVVDLCAEFPKSRAITAERYFLIPTLDATSPTPDQLRDAVDAVVSTGGQAFIHCAFGHGRSATVAAAVLIRRGLANIDNVESLMKAKRPRIGLNATQRTALAEAVRS